MQKWLSNIVVLFVLVATPLPAQDQTDWLAQADSLYDKKKFAEAQQIYYQLFQGGYSTPSTLLKMAFVYEGLDDIPRALFFLTQYYSQTEDSKAYDKILVLSNARNLKGYEMNDLDRALMWIDNRSITVVLLLLMSGLASSLIMFIPAIKRLPNIKIALGVLSIFLFSLLILVLNFGAPANRGVIAKKTYIMNGPSPGANFITILEGGNRVPVLGNEDVWVKINWNDKVGYVKRSDLLLN